MFEDHEPTTIRRFGGIFNKGEDDSCPFDHFLDSRNVRFLNEGVKTREGASLSITLSAVERFAIYKRTGEATRLLLLDNTGKLWDSTNLAAPILNIAGMTDFSAVTLFNRAYITPHNGVRGLPGESVYVYDGTGVARLAGGVRPTGFVLGVADSGLSGNVEAGERVFAVAYETASGFITGPGPAVYTRHTSAGGFKLNITSIQAGPAGTVARHLLATKAITDYDGNQAVQTYFFIPGGAINDNVTTSLTVDFFDADLQEDATFLLEQLDTIPAGTFLTYYKAHLVVGGSNANEHTAYVSRAGEPESFNSVEGFLSVSPGDPDGGVKNAVEYRSLLYLLKSQSTHVTKDTGDEAAFWEVDAVDPTIGTDPHGLLQVLDKNGNLMDFFLIADRTGIRVFNGIYGETPLTDKIQDIWYRINKNAFNKVQAGIDTVGCLIFATVPLDGAVESNTLIVGDYNEGLDPEHIRWDIWSFPNEPTCIALDVNNTTKEVVFKYGSKTGNVYLLAVANTDDFGTAIDSWFKPGLQPQGGDDGGVYHCAGVRLRARGTGNLAVTGYDYQGNSTEFGSLALAGTVAEKTLPVNLESEGLTFRFRVSNSGENFVVKKLVIFLQKIWESRPL